MAGLDPRTDPPRDDDQHRGPYVIIAAFWSEEDCTDEVAEAVRESKFPTPEGKPRGAVVSFRREIAESLPFEEDLRRFDLAELFEGDGTRADDA